jgi:hypothetical protein
MKAPPPLAQLTVPRGTDLVKSRAPAAPLLLARCGHEKHSANRFFAVLLGCTNEQIARTVTGARSGAAGRA